MNPILEINDLRKSFGSNKVIDGISLSVPEGSIFGFIGANGAGKTTTMKMVLGLLASDGGEIRVCGKRVQFGATSTAPLVGYLPDVPEFYGYMKPREYLRLCGEIAGMSSSAIKERSDKLLALVGLAKANKKIGSFSRGMKQRLGVAQALINSPRLLICDEPTSALDPMGRKEILDILASIRGETTVIFSTHILSDVERICDRAAVLHGGKLVMNGTLAELRGAGRTDTLRIEFSTLADLDRFGTLAPRPLFGDVTRDVNTLTIRSREIGWAHTATLRTLADNSILPIRVELLEPTIENLYLEAITK